MSEKVDLYRYDKALTVDRRVKKTLGVLGNLVTVALVLFYSVLLWMVGIGWVVLLLGGLVAVAFCCSFYYDNVTKVIQQGKEHGVKDE